MPQSTSGSLAATGSVALAKPPGDVFALVQISGTYGSVSFVVEGTIDGTNWFALAGSRLDTGLVVTGAISPADNATQAWRFLADGTTQVRARVTAISSNTAAFALASYSALGVPPALGSATSALTVPSLNVSGEFAGQIQVAAANGAVTVKSGCVFITKGSACALTIADPTAGTDDGKELAIVATTAFAHTVDNSAGSGFNQGGGAADVATFTSARGNNIVLTAYNGKWYVVSSINATLA